MDTRTTDPSDWNPAEWAPVQRVIPAPEPGGRPAKPSRRAIVNAPLSVARTGGPWHASPHDFPPRAAASWLFRIGAMDGTFDRLMDPLRGDLRPVQGRRRQPPAARIDTPSGPDDRNRGVRDSDAHEAVHGRRRHIPVDTLGLILSAVARAADIQDRDGAELVLGPLRRRFTRLRRIVADAID